MVGRQTPFLALIVPLILIGMVDGRRGIRQAWPVAVVGGLDLRARPVRVLELHLGRADRHRRLAARARPRSSRSLRVWQPGEPLLAEDGRRALPAARRRPARSVHDARDGARGRAAATTPSKDPPLRRAARLRALPDHHRGASRSPRSRRSRTRSPSRRGRPRSSGPGSTWRTPDGEAAQQPHLQRQLAARRGHAAADLRA